MSMRITAHSKVTRLTQLVLTCALLLTAVSSAYATSWNRQTSGTLGWLHSVFFVNQKTGWAVGSKGAMLKTTDGGASWTMQERATEDSLTDIYFSNDRDGWLVCEANVYELKEKDAPRPSLMRTNDGGYKWEKVDVSGDDVRGNVDTRLLRVFFSPGGRGWVIGETGTAYTSRDDGETWKRIQVPTRYLLLGGAFVDNDRGWLVGAGGTILQTADGGDSWHQSRVTDIQGVRFTSVSFVDNRIGWVVGNGGRIFRTINGGRTWMPQASGVVVDLLDVKFLNDLEGWAVGAGGTIIRTFDGGLHWTAEVSGTSHPLERIF